MVMKQSEYAAAPWRRKAGEAGVLVRWKKLSLSPTE